MSPMYDFECTNCAYKFEQICTVAAMLNQRCPKCNRLTKVILNKVAPVKFNADGFYKDVSWNK